MRVRVNGEWEQTEDRTVGDVLRRWGLENKKVVVEANGTILEPASWDATALTDGMILEIVHFVGGG
jgi:sulfur carrier protein